MADFGPKFRGLARVSAESRMGGFLRKIAMSKDARVESRFTSGQAIAAGVRNLGFSDFLTQYGPSDGVDTLYVLGSGSSVNKLTSNQFEEIATQRSVGINTWAVHPFVPSFYCFESVPWVGDGRDFYRSLSLLRRDDIVHRDPAILILRPKKSSEFQALAEVPRELQSNIHFYGRVTPATRNRANLLDDIDYFFESLVTKHPGLVLDSGASVVRMVALGIIMGFRKIVLVGVDLNGSPYFWEQKPHLLENLRSERPVNNQQSEIHETRASSNRVFGALTMLATLGEFIRLKLGGTILTTSLELPIAETLTIHEWSTSTSGG